MSAVNDAAAYAAESNLPTILGVLTAFFFLALVIVGMRMAVAMDIVKSYYQQTYSATTDETYLIFFGLYGVLSITPYYSYIVNRFSTSLDRQGSSSLSVRAGQG